MKDIELPEFRTLVANLIYGQVSEPLPHPILGDLPSTRLLRLERFIVPTEEEVLKYIITTAKETVSCTEEERMKTPIGCLPLEVIKEIAQEDKDALDHLQKHFPNEPLQENKPYLTITTGVLADQDFKTCHNNENTYEKAIHHSDKKGLLLINLKGGYLPSRSNINFLLDKGVKDCDLYRTFGEMDESASLAKYFCIVYSALHSRKLIDKLIDNSSRVLKSKASNISVELSKCLLGQKMGEMIREDIIGKLPDLSNILGMLKDNPFSQEQSHRRRMNWDNEGNEDCDRN
ncbi:MAG: hypothetical protein AABY22_17545 [Nanoarchaeota archaeon]